MKRALTFFLFLFVVINSRGAMKNVPANFATIQDALNACSSYDTVLVQAGTYYENIVWPNDTIKGLTLISASGSQNTTIDGGNIGRVITLNGQSMFDPMISIVGFTITNGELDNLPDLSGGGLYINLAHVSLKDLVVTSNTLIVGTRSFGAGIFADSVNLELNNCMIDHNYNSGSPWAFGCGLYSSFCNTTIYNCKFLDNYSVCPMYNYGCGIYNERGTIAIESSEFKNNINEQQGSGESFGAGIYLKNCSADILNCLFVDNEVDTVGPNGSGAAIYFYDNYTLDSTLLDINYCTMVCNYTDIVNQLSLRASNFGSMITSASIKNSIIWGAAYWQVDTALIGISIQNCNIDTTEFPGNGNFSADPLFINTVDYHLSPISPCVNRGATSLGVDKDGNMRPAPVWHHNDIGCYEVNETLNGHEISGLTFIDLNNNGIYDSTDALYNNVLIYINQNQYNAISVNGNYSISLPDNNYTVRSESIPGIHLTTSPSVYTINTAGTNVSNLDFGYFPDIPHDYEIETFITSQIPRCNTIVPYVLSILNTGIRNASGVFAFEKDLLMTIISATPMYDSIVGNIYYWHYDNLPPFTRQDLITINILMPGGGNTVNVFSHANALDSLGNTIDTTSNTLSQVIRCSLDPNLKTASPSDNVFSDPNAFITYSIYFQNTGNDTAFNVRLVDTLDALLDPTSFEVIESSHNYNVEIEAGNVVSFVFDNILLPDSNVNLAGSEGHITYRIRPLEVVPDFSIIQNTAYIYFDMNPPINTNTTTSTIHEATVGVINLSTDNFEISAFPNPSYSDIHIRLSSINISNKYTAELFDVNGKVVQKYENLRSSEFTISEENLLSGKYILRVTDSKKKTNSIKLVIK